MDAKASGLELAWTADGSPTLYNPELNEHYHSVKGALTEALHVFIGYGLNFHPASELSILEVGLGTGLNAALTAMEAEKQRRRVDYVALEPFPADEALLQEFIRSFEGKEVPTGIMREIAASPWNISSEINEYFSFRKFTSTLEQFSSDENFDLIYFDAFAPSRQAELWTAEMMIKMYSLLEPGGVLVSYCAQGDFRRNLKAAGFKVKKLKGPPGGKWQNTRALKSVQE